MFISFSQKMALCPGNKFDFFFLFYSKIEIEISNNEILRRRESSKVSLERKRIQKKFNLEESRSFSSGCFDVGTKSLEFLDIIWKL